MLKTAKMGENQAQTEKREGFSTLLKNPLSTPCFPLQGKRFSFSSPHPCLRLSRGFPHGFQHMWKTCGKNGGFQASRLAQTLSLKVFVKLFSKSLWVFRATP
jgi:hypothetical protein